MGLYNYKITFIGKEIIESDYEFVTEWEARTMARIEIEEKIKEIKEYYPEYEIDDIDSDDININTYENDFDYEISEEFEDEDEIAPSWSERYLNTLGMSMSDFL